MNFDRQEIFKKQITKRVKKLIELESLLKSEFSFDGNDFKISRKIYACLDGFVVLRTFSESSFEPFQFIANPVRLDSFIKNNLPIRTNQGIKNLTQLLKISIGLDLKRGQTIDIGSRGSGIQIGSELKIDGFQLLIRDYKDIEETQDLIEDMINSHIAYFSQEKIESLQKQNEELRTELTKAVEKINKFSNPIIITEGKSDWKYFIAALRYYHSNNEFLQIDSKWFLKFGTKEDIDKGICDADFELTNSNAHLQKLLVSFIESRKIDRHNDFPLRIGIFDSDDEKYREIIDLDNNVFALLIQPSDISTEFLFSETELKSNINEKRLFLGLEFDDRSGQLLTDRSINLGNDNNAKNKAGKNKIIDSSVFDGNGNNIALSKDDFAKAIYLNELNISPESWQNFRHIFERILSFIIK